MQRLTLLVCLLAASAAGQATKTIIQDTLHTQTGLWKGDISITTPGMICNGVPYALDQTKFHIVGGVVNIGLYPNDNCQALNGQANVYHVAFVPFVGKVWAELWLVPSSISPIQLDTVRQGAKIFDPVGVMALAQINSADAIEGQCIVKMGLSYRPGSCSSVSMTAQQLKDAIGYTPYDSTNPAGYITLADVPAGTGTGTGTGTGGPGTKGDTGPAGPAGPAGPPGVDGLTGAAGLKGDTGPAGPTGLAGPEGSQGPWGVQGSRGDIGAAGPQGIKGDIGSIGLTGPQGNLGLTGPQGIQGDTGPVGPIGITGLQGIQGTTGDVGPAGSQGIQGPIGLIGPIGATGLQGIQGIQGDQGAKGDTGTTGAVGATGATGSIIWAPKAVSFMAVLGSGYYVTAAAITASLPSATVTGQSISFISGLASGSFTITPSAGQTVMGFTSLTQDKIYAAFTLVYFSTTSDWRIL